MKKAILLNFDVEEFNLPLEYGLNFPKEKQFEFSHQGLKKILNLLKVNNINSTFFVTASFALKYPALLKHISKEHEIASHGLNHNAINYNPEDVKKSKEIIEKIINKKIEGFRFPKLKKISLSSLKKIGFKYDSSICPTYLPGRYNNYFEKRKINLSEGIFEVPISTMKVMHLPFYWIFFRNFGLNYSKLLTIHCIKDMGYTNIFFHPWEFNDLSNFKLPFYITRNSGNTTLKMLEEYIKWGKKKKYIFSSIGDYLKKYFKM